MAKYITRTMVKTNATIMSANVESGSIENVDITLANSYKDDEALLKAAKKAYDGKNTLLKVISKTEEEEVWGVTPEQFMSMAVKVTRPASQQKKTADEQ